MTNAINWFEIPVYDYGRAKEFYSAVLGVEIRDMPMDEVDYGVFPYVEGKGVGGAIVRADGYEPAATGGCTVYFDGGSDLDATLAKVEKAGGKILQPKTGIGEHGFMARFLDTEGNNVALHTEN